MESFESSSIDHKQLFPLLSLSVSMKSKFMSPLRFRSMSKSKSKLISRSGTSRSGTTWFQKFENDDDRGEEHDVIKGEESLVRWDPALLVLLSLS